MASAAESSTAVLLQAHIGHPPLAELLTGYRLELCMLPHRAAIPGSFWGDYEAGLVGSRLYARAAQDARDALLRWGLLGTGDRATGTLREQPGR